MKHYDDPLGMWRTLKAIQQQGKKKRTKPKPKRLVHAEDATKKLFPKR
jgi:hypothetical protein